jgi:hypothetical protein
VPFEFAWKLLWVMADSIRYTSTPEYEPANECMDLFDIRILLRYNITTTFPGTCLIAGHASCWESINVLLPSGMNFSLVVFHFTT